MPKNYTLISAEDAKDILGGYSNSNYNFNIYIPSSSVFSTSPPWVGVRISYSQEGLKNTIYGTLDGANTGSELGLQGAAMGAIMGFIDSTSRAVESGQASVRTSFMGF